MPAVAAAPPSNGPVIASCARGFTLASFCSASLRSIRRPRKQRHAEQTSLPRSSGKRPSGEMQIPKRSSGEMQATARPSGEMQVPARPSGTMQKVSKPPPPLSKKSGRPSKPPPPDSKRSKPPPPPQASAAGKSVRPPPPTIVAKKENVEELSGSLLAGRGLLGAAPRTPAEHSVERARARRRRLDRAAGSHRGRSSDERDRRSAGCGS